MLKNFCILCEEPAFGYVDFSLLLLHSCVWLSEHVFEHRLLCSGDSPGKNTGVGCHFLLQGIFPIQGSNLSFLHCKRILYPLSHWFFPTVLNFTSLCSYLYYVLPVLSLICFLKILRLLIQNFLVSKVRHKSLFLCTSLVASYKFCNVFLLSTNWKFC